MLRKNTVLVAGVSLGAMILAAPVALSLVAERKVAHEIERAGLAADSVSVSPYSGTVVVHGLASADGSTRVGSLRWQMQPLAFIAPAQAQAGGFVIENIKTTLKQGSITIPKVTVEGASFSQDEITKLFTWDAGLPARLKGTNAALVTVPEIQIQASIDAQNKAEYTLKAVIAERLEAGKFARVTMADTIFATTAPGMTQDGVVKKTELTGFDMAHVAHVWFGTAAPGEKSTPIYESYVIDGMTSTIKGDTPLQMDLGKMTGRSVRMKPLKDRSLGSFVNDLLQASADRKTDPKFSKQEERAVLRKMLPALIDLFDSVEDDGVSGENMGIRTNAPDGKPVAFKIGRFAGSYGGGRVPPGFLLADIEMTAPDVTARLGHFGIAGFSYLPLFRGVMEALEKDGDFSAVDPRKFLPKIGEITVKGLEIDAPDPNSPAGVKPERINLKLGQFIVSGKNEVNGIPTDIRLDLQNLAFKLPEHSSDANIKMIKALGYGALDMSAQIAANWNEAGKEIRISEVSLGGVNMGSVKLNGTLGNIGRDVFEADAAMAQVALMGATAKAVSLKVENSGLAEKLLAMQARQQSRSADEIRKELGTLAALGIPAILGPSDDAKVISGAISRFLARPKALSIDVTAKNAGGIGIPDIATVGDPQSAMKLVSVKASAAD